MTVAGDARGKKIETGRRDALLRASRLALLLLSACSTAPIGGDFGTAASNADEEPARPPSAPSAPVDASADAGVEPRVTLTVTLAGSGTGSVLSVPSGLTCTGETCTGSFAAGATVGLVPAPGAAVTFVGWEGACTGGDTCTPMLAADTTVTARFESFAGTYTGPYEQSLTYAGCTFHDEGVLTITLASDGGGWVASGTIGGIELRRLPGCAILDANVTGAAAKSAVSVEASTLTGTLHFDLAGLPGHLALPYHGTVTGRALAGAWGCDGCSGGFSLTKKE